MICFDVSRVYVSRRKIKDGSRQSKLKELRLICRDLERKLFPNKIQGKYVQKPREKC